MAAGFFLLALTRTVFASFPVAITRLSTRATYRPSYFEKSTAELEMRELLSSCQLGRRDVVIGEGAGLYVPGLDRAAAVGREGQRVGGSGVGDLDDPIGGAAHELKERAGLAAVDEAGDPPAGCGVLDLVEEVDIGRGHV